MGRRLKEGKMAAIKIFLKGSRLKGREPGKVKENTRP